MATSELINIQRLTGVVLIASFISFAIGGILPIVGKKAQSESAMQRAQRR